MKFRRDEGEVCLASFFAGVACNLKFWKARIISHEFGRIERYEKVDS